jgi:hypothetical protein
MSEPTPDQAASSQAMYVPQLHCQGFPDLCLKDLKGLHDEELIRARAENRKKDLMYRAVRHIMVNDFGFTSDLPARVESFPGNLEEAQIAQFLAVYGLLLADNYDDATLGKDRPSGDDMIVRDPDPKRSFFIASRFLDQVVKSVQEYSAQATLFQKVYTLMNEEGAQPSGTTARRRPSTMASV